MAQNFLLSLTDSTSNLHLGMDVSDRSHTYLDLSKLPYEVRKDITDDFIVLYPLFYTHLYTGLYPIRELPINRIAVSINALNKIDAIIISCSNSPDIIQHLLNKVYGSYSSKMHLELGDLAPYSDQEENSGYGWDKGDYYVSYTRDNQNTCIYIASTGKQL